MSAVFCFFFSATLIHCHAFCSDLNNSNFCFCILFLWVPSLERIVWKFMSFHLNQLLKYYSNLNFYFSSYFSCVLLSIVQFFSSCVGLVLAPATSAAGASGKHSSGNNVLQNAYIARGVFHHWCRFTVFIVYNIHQIHRPRLHYRSGEVVYCSGLLHHIQLIQIMCMISGHE